MSNINLEIGVNKLIALLGFTIGIAHLSLAEEQQKSGYEELEKLIEERVAAADANHDGKITRDEANGNLPRVYNEYAQIDTTQKNFLTLEEIKAYLMPNKEKN